MAEYVPKAALQKIDFADNFKVSLVGRMVAENIRASNLATFVMEELNLDINAHVSQKVRQETRIISSDDVQTLCLKRTQ
jgi:protein-tyrosine-phosphatase